MNSVVVHSKSEIIVLAIIHGATELLLCIYRPLVSPVVESNVKVLDDPAPCRPM